MSGAIQLLLAGGPTGPEQETYDFSTFYLDNGLSSKANLSPSPSNFVKRQITDIRVNSGKRRSIENQVKVTYPSYPTQLTASNPRGIYVSQSTTATRKIFSGFATTTDVNILSLVTSYNTSNSFNIGQADISGTLESLARLSSGSIFELIFFSSNGLTLFCGAYGGSTIYQYSLSSAFNLGSSSFTFVRSYNIASAVTDIHFSSNGTVMYAVTDFGYVLKKALPSAWNLPSSGSAADSSAALPTGAYPAQGLWVSDDETIILTAMYDGNATHGIRQSEGTSISSNNYSLAYSFTTNDPPYGLAVDPNKNLIYWHEDGSLGEYLLQANLRLYSYADQNVSYLNWVISAQALSFKSDGTKIYIADFNGVIRERTLSTAWDLSTISNTDSATYTTGLGAITGLTFKPDGTKVYFNGILGFVYERSLSTAWDISSASGISSFSVGSYPSTLTNTQFSSDGTKMYVGVNNNINQYNLSTAWDVTSAASSTSVGGTGYKTAGFFLSPNLTQLIVFSRSFYTRIYKLNNPGLLNSLGSQSGVSISTEMRDNVLALSYLAEPISIYGENYLMSIYAKPDMTEVFALGSGNQGLGLMKFKS
jgi:hypothetical protein